VLKYWQGIKVSDFAKTLLLASVRRYLHHCTLFDSPRPCIYHQKEKFDKAAARQIAVNRRMKESNILRDKAAGNRCALCYCVVVLYSSGCARARACVTVVVFLRPVLAIQLRRRVR
jgi:hypothetical protein